MQRFLVVMTVLVAATTAALAQSAGIVPGEALGIYRLGQDASPILASLGPLYEESDVSAPTFRGYFWPLRRVGVMVDTRTKRVAALELSLDDTLQTSNGIGVGSTKEAVRSAFGIEDSTDPGDDSDTLVYDSRGVAFVVDRDGALRDRVSRIYIFGRGDFRRIFPPDEE